MSAQASIEEARLLANLLIEKERRRVGGIDLAIHRVSARLQVEEGALKSLRYRWRSLTSIPAHVLDSLREEYENFYEQQRRKLSQEILIAEQIQNKSEHLERVLQQAQLVVGDQDE